MFGRSFNLPWFYSEEDSGDEQSDFRHSPPTLVFAKEKRKEKYVAARQYMKH